MKWVVYFVTFEGGSGMLFRSPCAVLPLAEILAAVNAKGALQNPMHFPTNSVFAPLFSSKSVAVSVFSSKMSDLCVCLLAAR